MNHSASSLAYIGDAVFELCVREMLLSAGNRPVNALNQMALQYVTAKAQAKMYHAVVPFLSEEEENVLRRGRNLHSHSKAKSANMSEYRHATGLETLFGYLYITGQKERLTEIFALCTKEDEVQQNEDEEI